MLFFYYLHSSSSNLFESLQVYLNLHLFIIFEFTSIYVHVPLNKSIVERMRYIDITTNSYESIFARMKLKGIDVGPHKR